MFTDHLLLQGQIEWNIPLLFGIIIVGVFYVFLIHRFTDLKVFHKPPLFFILSLCLLYIAIGSPLTTIIHLSFSLHMLQMSIIYFVIPPLCLLGIPTNLCENMKVPKVSKVIQPLLSPMVALITFAILFLIYHLPAVLAILSNNVFFQNIIIFVLLMLAFCMWLPVVSPIPTQRYRKEQKKHYVFLSGLLLMPACLFFIISAFLGDINNPFLTQLTAHICAPSQSSELTILPTPFNTKYDQVFAGILMLTIHKVSLIATTKMRSE